MSGLLRLLLMLGCVLSLAVTTSISSPPIAAATPVCLVSTDPHVPISVTQGGQFVIALRSNRSTGYQWQLARPVDNDIVRLVNSEYVASVNLPGAGGKECWPFRAVGAGGTTIALDYVRPFDPQSIAQSEDFYVIVRPWRLY
jgi:predicted secreted protein